MNHFARTLLIMFWVAVTGLSVVRAADMGNPDDSGRGKILSPKTIDGVTIVDADGLIEKVMDIDALVLIDSRITADRKEGYIEGSIGLPDIETTCDTIKAVVKDRATPVLFYCNGIRCGRSAKAAQIALDCGYSEIYWYRSGMEEWQAKQYPLVQ